ncbi:MAG: hypothetical protein COU29_00380 [Candidatus Magasanikbacteria bacterium CG10_big_fil_rev_8_21_14_0_10_36_32]|uniref:Uncharacterized protein n=1 Tax=Candidatus Magasanikbacteria bacterium CG10_big_fil_rev_8_21_14_0_10_36_32 TaxID=1974646 RepID=A0A2M6W7N3_9BACT|nr:MAG: hypothetical protein COU29_00380 [Candidatus Magasanikbacteria bacterium CG10_big_fil_rev_8_21_14_0_10_36_32]
MFIFSPQLIARLQQHFITYYGLVLTPEQTDEYLHSFAELFLVFNQPPESSTAGYAGLTPQPPGAGSSCP